MERPSWKEYFFGIAEQVKSRSTCVRRQVGCVIINQNKSILATGYNGAPSRAKHCTEETCLRKDIPSGSQLDRCKAVHAEQNAICQAVKNGVKLDNSIMYCTCKPCFICLKMLVNSGIKTIYYKNDYPSDLVDDMIKEPDIEIELIACK